MRLAAAAIWHETLSFAHTRTGLEDFRAFQFTEGSDVIAKNRGVRNEMGGFLAGAEQFGAETYPMLFAGALPSPTVSSEAYAHIRQRLLDHLAAAPHLDGMLLALHGAMVVEGVDDPEVDILTAIREKTGPTFPIVVTLDLHANVSKDLFELADALIAYDTYPHIDIFDRGVEAVHVMNKLLRGTRLAKAFRKLPLLTAPQGQATAAEPMRSIMQRVHEWEADPRVVAISVCPGYAYSDVPRLGFSIAVYTDGDSPLAERIADDVAGMVWERRAQFAATNTPPAEAVRIAKQSGRIPVILVDAADNIGGGTPGDGTALLRELIGQDAQGAVVTIADAAAAEACVQAGVGAEVDLEVGGKYDNNHGPPVRVRGYVRLISDGVYRHAGSYMTGMRVEMGKTAVLVVGGVEIAIMSRKAMPFDAQQLLSLGITLSSRRAIVVKSAIAWRSAYGDIAGEVVTVDTPGLCTSTLSLLPYRRRPKLFPLDDMAFLAS